jgi:DNA-binding NarL/FixJ family response regulator
MKLPSRRRARPEPTRIAKLSDREKQVVELLSQGRSVPEISRELWITQTTVEAHLRHAFHNLSEH